MYAVQPGAIKVEGANEPASELLMFSAFHPTSHCKQHIACLLCSCGKARAQAIKLLHARRMHGVVLCSA